MADKRADRASQFIPFDALKGFREALRQKEKEAEEKHGMLYLCPDKDGKHGDE